MKQGSIGLSLKVRKSMFRLTIALAVSLPSLACAPVSSGADAEIATNSLSQSEIAVIFGAKGTSFLSKEEKAFFENGQDLPALSPVDAESLARRMSFEAGKAENTKDYEAARKYRHIIRDIHQRRVEASPDDIFGIFSLSTAIAKFGRLEILAGEPEAARDYFNESLDILERNEVDSSLQSLRLKLMSSKHRDLGDLEKSLKNHEAAKVQYLKYLNLVVKNPTSLDYFLDRAEAHHLLAELSLVQNKYSESYENYEAAIRVLRKSLSNKNSLDELIRWVRLGDLYQRHGYAAYLNSDDEKTIETFKKGIVARKSAMEAERATVTEAFDHAAAYYFAAKYTSGNEDYYHQAGELFDELAKTDKVPLHYVVMLKDISSRVSP